MAVVIQLLGPPLVVSDGVVHAAPKGRKAWALLAYLSLAGHSPTRQELIELLFPEADDPAGALRWNLSELRRLLGGSETVGSGTTVQLRLPGGSLIDARVLMEGSSLEAVELPGLGRELLEGVEIEGSAGFSAWLLGERRRLRALSGAVLRDGALQALAAGDAARAVNLATRLVSLDALDEDSHVLLIRAFAGTGDRFAAERQLETSADLLRRELDVEPGPELAAAAKIEPEPPSREARAGRASLQALIDSGRAAVSAGAVETGLEALRAAVVGCREAGETALESAALLELGTALVHATKGRDEEGAAALHRCIAAAEPSGDRSVSAAAHRELAYVEVLRGNYQRAHTLLRAAEDLAEGDLLELARVRAIMGTSFGDVGEHERAATAQLGSIEISNQLGQRKQEAWSLTFVGRTRLLRGEIDAAAEALERARRLSTDERWTAFMPLPEVLAAEVAIRRGDLALAQETFEHALALASQVDDACWESYAIRGLGLVRAARSDIDGALETIGRAVTACARQRDTHRWVRAYALDALCAVAVATRHPMAGRWITDLASLAGRTGMRELAARAYLHRRDLGDGTATDAARVLSADVENPHLRGLVEDEGVTLLDDVLGKAG